MTLPTTCRCGEPLTADGLLFGRCPGCGDLHDPAALAAARRGLNDPATDHLRPAGEEVRRLLVALVLGGPEGSTLEQLARDADQPPDFTRALLEVVSRHQPAVVHEGDDGRWRATLLLAQRVLWLLDPTATPPPPPLNGVRLTVVPDPPEGGAA